MDGVSIISSNTIHPSSDTVSINTESSFDGRDLQSLECAGFVSILEDALDQIALFGSTAEQLDLNAVTLRIDSLKDRCLKYYKNDPVYNCLNGEIFNLTLNKMKFLKLQYDRSFLEHVLTVTKDEIYEYCSFDHLKTFLEEYKKAQNAEEILISQQKYNKAYAQALKQAVHKQQEESKNEIRKAHLQIAKCKDQMESFLFDNALKTRYIESWENARIEQGYLMCDQNEQNFQEEISKYKNEIDKEIRINAEIVNYIAENQKDMDESIESWIKRYETELEEKQMQLTLYKEKREEQKKRYDQMLKTYETHAQEIEDWLIYKENKRQREEHERLIYESAARLQRWWRRMMFQHKLGPWNPDQAFGKKKKDKKKDKKGKKGKKKK